MKLIALVVVVSGFALYKWLESICFFPAFIFPNLSLIDTNAIIAEYNKYEQQLEVHSPELHLYGEEYGGAGLWKMTPLLGFGRVNDKAKKFFPQTFKELDKITGLKTAFFSVLASNTRMVPHQGLAELSNNVLRFQLGIKVPSDGRNGVEVEGKFKPSEIGQWLVFDDSKSHLGLNESPSSERVALIVDIDRPWFVLQGKSTNKMNVALDSYLQNNY
jgi:aspartyl/asparaginyl beta-hydroxylase (cupin superfamily)